MYLHLEIGECVEDLFCIMLHMKLCKPCPVVLTAQVLVYFCKYEVCSLVLIHVNVKIGENSEYNSSNILKIYRLHRLRGYAL